MDDSTRLREDLDFVRSSVERTGGPLGPRSIFVFWALAVLAGFALGDFAPERMSLYWSIVGPLGWIVSAVLGARYSRRVGQLDMRRGFTQAGHFGLMLVAIFLIALLAHRQVLSWQAMGPLVVLMLAFTYALAGLHFNSAFFVPAAMFTVGFGVLIWVDAWPWTVVGVLSAIGLLFTGFVGSARDAAPQT